MIRNARVRYHRNGVAGEDFHTVSFVEGRGRTAKHLRAVVFEGRGQCAVVDPADAGARFCGDYYESALRQAIAAAADCSLTYADALEGNSK